MIWNFCVFGFAFSVIGGWAGTRVIIRRKQGANVLRDVQLVDILANDKWIAFLIQITTRTVAINYFFTLSHPFLFSFCGYVGLT